MIIEPIAISRAGGALPAQVALPERAPLCEPVMEIHNRLGFDATVGVNGAGRRAVVSFSLGLLGNLGWPAS